MRNIAAHCPKCGGEEFEAQDGRGFELASQTTLLCVACNASATYVQLIMQIAQKAVTHSAATLEEIRRKRGG